MSALLSSCNSDTKSQFSLTPSDAIAYKRKVIIVECGFILRQYVILRVVYSLLVFHFFNERQQNMITVSFHIPKIIIVPVVTHQNFSTMLSPIKKLLGVPLVRSKLHIQNPKHGVLFIMIWNQGQGCHGKYGVVTATTGSSEVSQCNIYALQGFYVA